MIPSVRLCGRRSLGGAKPAAILRRAASTFHKPQQQLLQYVDERVAAIDGWKGREIMPSTAALAAHTATVKGAGAGTGIIIRRPFTTTSAATGGNMDTTLNNKNKNNDGDAHNNDGLIHTTRDIVDLIRSQEFVQANQAWDLYMQGKKKPTRKMKHFQDLLKACRQEFQRIETELKGVEKAFTAATSKKNNHKIRMTGKQMQQRTRGRKSLQQLAKLTSNILQCMVASETQLDESITAAQFSLVIHMWASCFSPKGGEQAEATLQLAIDNYKLRNYKPEVHRPKQTDFNNIVTAYIHANNQLDKAEQFLMQSSSLAITAAAASASGSIPIKDIVDACVFQPNAVGYHSLITGYRRYGKHGNPVAADRVLRRQLEVYQQMNQFVESARQDNTNIDGKDLVTLQQIKDRLVPTTDLVNYTLACWAYCGDDTTNSNPYINNNKKKDTHQYNDPDEFDSDSDSDSDGKDNHNNKETGRGSIGITPQEAYDGAHTLYNDVFVSPAEGQNQEHHHHLIPLKPDAYSYYLLLDNHARRGDIAGAEQIFRQLFLAWKSNPGTTTPVEVQHLNSVLKACARAFSSDQSAMDRATAILQDARHRHSVGQLPFGLNETSYNTILHAFGVAGQPKLAVKLLDDMIHDYRSGNTAAKPGLLTFNFILYSLVQLGGSIDTPAKQAGEQADYIVQQQMPLFNVQPDYNSYKSLRRCWLKAKAAGYPRAFERIGELNQILNLDNSANTIGGYVKPRMPQQNNVKPRTTQQNQPKRSRSLRRDNTGRS